MIHKTRAFCVVDVSDLDTLADKLMNYSWTLCTGFRYQSPQGPLLLLNDAFSEDGAQEYAVIWENDRAQIESLTVSWMETDRLSETITQLCQGDPPIYQAVPNLAIRIQTPEQHGRCPLCA